MRAWLDPVAVRDAWRAFVWSRLLVLGAASFGSLLFADGIASGNASPDYTHPFGDWPASGLIDFLFTPFIRWDAQWYLTIAEDGYEPLTADIGARPAFFPVYPMLIKVLGGFASSGAAVVAAIAISLVSLLGALYLLHRLIAIELGEQTARDSVWVLALCPVAFYFSAPFTEALFLLLTVGAFYAARTDRWLAAGVLGGIASATRPTGVLLLIPLLMLYLRDRGPASAATARRAADRARAVLARVRPNIVWLGLVPSGLLAFSYYLLKQFGDAQEWREAQFHFGRTETVAPWIGLKDAAVELYDAIRGDVADELQAAIILESGFLIFAVIAIVGVFRILPAAYGAYCVAVLIPPLAQPALGEPLTAYPRYTLTLFPLWVWLAHYGARRGIGRGVLAGCAASLAFLSAAFASWAHLP